MSVFIPADLETRSLIINDSARRLVVNQVLLQASFNHELPSRGWRYDGDKSGGTKASTKRHVPDIFTISEVSK
jgi:hypothetical protein